MVSATSTKTQTYKPLKFAKLDFYKLWLNVKVTLPYLYSRRSEYFVKSVVEIFTSDAPFHNYLQKSAATGATSGSGRLPAAKTGIFSAAQQTVKAQAMSSPAGAAALYSCPG